MHYIKKFADFVKKNISVWACLAVILGGAIQAFGVYNVHSISGVTEGGVTGLELLFYNHFGISPSVSGLVMNALCYIFGFKILGKPFLFYSALSNIGFSGTYAIIERFDRVYPAIAEMPLAAAIIGALFIGIGAGISVAAGGATTGDDALAMGMCDILHIKIQWIYLVSDVTVLLLSLTYLPLGRIIYSLITVILSGQIIGLVCRILKKRGDK